MKKIRLFLLLTFLVLASTLPVFSQTMSNTDNVITLTNTCFNGGVSNGSYSLELSYFDLDSYSSPTVTLNVTVAVSGGVMTITAPAGSFPSANTRGWSLYDAYPGHFKLTSGSFVTYMTFFLNPDGVTDGFNCVPLPIDFNSFTGFASGGQVTLHWQTGLEQNSTYIEIYRAPGNGNYYKIGQVTAAGNSSIPVNYTFTDTHPCSTNTYYLKMLNSQGTLPIYSGYLPVGCSGCSCTLPSPVYCNFTINGPDYLCTPETPTVYTLSSPVPNYSNIVWSLDQPSAAYLRTYPDVDRAKVTLLKKNAAASATLTATLSGCTNTISKYIAIGTPTPYISSTLDCPNAYLYAGNRPGATSFEWNITDGTSGYSMTVDNTVPGWQGPLVWGDIYYVSVIYTNACGTSDFGYIYGVTCECYDCDPGGHGFMVSPNPSKGIVTIGLAPATVPAPAVTSAGKKGSLQTPTAEVKPKVYQVRVIDAKGVVRKKLNYPGGAITTSVDLSGLINGVYIIQVFDNKTWKSTKVILAK